MNLKIYQVDAFADKVFSGNPAAVCPLNFWPEADLMQKIAMENNLAETAFYVKNGNKYDIRWFTPVVEVDLCGHATLATAFIIFNKENYPGDVLEFHSHRSGSLKVYRQGDFLTLDFPTDQMKQVEVAEEHWVSLGVKPKSVFRGKTDFMFVFDSEAQIRSLQPDFRMLGKLQCRGVIATSRGDKSDFVSRFFAPQSGINEDPVTGSAHTTLTPYWSKQLNKKEMSAIQLSARKGYLKCTDSGDRTFISGQARLYMEGEIVDY